MSFTYDISSNAISTAEHTNATLLPFIHCRARRSGCVATFHGSAAGFNGVPKRRLSYAPRHGHDALVAPARHFSTNLVEQLNFPRATCASQAPDWAMKKDLSRIVERTRETETNLQGCLLISNEVFGTTNEDVVRGVKLAKWRTARRSSRGGLCCE